MIACFFSFEDVCNITLNDVRTIESSSKRNKIEKVETYFTKKKDVALIYKERREI